jgi:hypothetical protein
MEEGVSTSSSPFKVEEIDAALARWEAMFRARCWWFLPAEELYASATPEERETLVAWREELLEKERGHLRNRLLAGLQAGIVVRGTPAADIREFRTWIDHYLVLTPEQRATIPLPHLP